MVDIVDSKWSERDAGNNSAAPNGWQTGYLANTIAPTGRQMMAAMKRWFNNANAIYTTTGASNGYVLTFEQGPPAYKQGLFYVFFLNHTNTGPSSLNLNTLGAKAIVRHDGSALAGGELQSGTVAMVYYDGTAFRLYSNHANPKFSGTVTADGFSTSGPLTAGATTVLNLTTSGTVTAGNLVSPGLTINGAAGTDRIVGWKSAGTQRWSAFTNASPESGGNVGSDFAVARYADNGNYIDAPLLINRATGNVSIEKQLNVKGRVYVGTGGTFLETDGNIVFTGSMTSQGSTLSEALGRKAPLASPNFSGVVGLPGVSANEFKQGTADGASYSQYNLAMKGWWGLGMQDHTNTVNGFYDFRAGKWDTKGGTFKNGTEYVLPNGGMYNVNVLGSAGGIRDTGSAGGNLMRFNWNGQPGQPSWVWGGVNGADMYVYNPSNFTVANSAQLGGIVASEYQTKSTVFQSGNQTYTINALGSVAHGLGRKPNWYIAEMVCTTAANGWSVGDTFDQASCMQPWAGQGSFGIHIWATATTINWKVGANGIGILQKTGGGSEIAPMSNWALRFRAGF
ncbi:hypothetical protein JZX86_27745 [Agrobacterium rosae]|uniref:hypothetical protein n=1 Tax=Agrobacterium rosae TaxID=1972867 RepID=UPI0019D33A4C|nr:hypothetical protein [Agrobacterium rosae]MBN7809117.1 hypothetical protein [Agrobacterium rosae]